MSHFSGHFEGASTFLTPKLSRAIPQFLKQRDINSFMYRRAILCTFHISVDFYYVPVGRIEGGEGGWRRGGD